MSPPDFVSWTGLIHDIARGEPTAEVRLAATFSRGIRLLSIHYGAPDPERVIGDVLAVVAQGIRRGEVREDTGLPRYVRTVFRDILELNS